MGWQVEECSHWLGEQTSQLISQHEIRVYPGPQAFLALFFSLVQI